MTRAAEATLRRRLGNNLHRLRKAAGLTQQEVADRAELDLRHYQKCEHGESNAKLTTLASLANGLGVDVTTLLERPPRR